MKKSIFGRKFKRNKNQRTALFKGLVSSMILNERIKTTEAKAKAIKGHVEKIVTKAKKDKRVLVAPYVYPNAIDKLFDDIAKRFINRNGGYTRIVRIGQRLGDQATMVLLEWTEAPLPAVAAKKELKASKSVKEDKTPVRQGSSKAKPTAKKPRTAKAKAK